MANLRHKNPWRLLASFFDSTSEAGKNLSIKTNIGSGQTYLSQDIPENQLYNLHINMVPVF
jgi:hypothetical protein